MRAPVAVVLAAAAALAGAAPATADLGPLRDLAAARPGFPVLSVAPHGRAALAWVDQTAGATLGVRLAVRDAGGQFRDSALVHEGGDAGEVAVAVGDRGGAVVAYTGSAGLAIRRQVGGTLQPEEHLVAAGPRLSRPVVAVDGAGNAVAAWIADEARVQASWAPAGSAFGAAQTLATYPYADGPSVVATGDGTAVLAFSAVPVGGPAPTVEHPARFRAQIAGLRLGAATTAPRPLAASSPAPDETELNVRLVHAGSRTVALWPRYVPTFAGAAPGGSTRYATIRADGTVAAETTVPATVAADSVAINPAGRALFGGSNGGGGDVYGAAGALGAEPRSFTVDTELYQGAGVLAAIDKAGTGVLVWSHEATPPTISTPGDHQTHVAVVPAGAAGACAPRVIAHTSNAVVAFDEIGGGVFATADGAAVRVAEWTPERTPCPVVAKGPATPPATVNEPPRPVVLTSGRRTVTITTAAHPVLKLRLRCRASFACSGPVRLTAGGAALATGRLRPIPSGRAGTLTLRPGTRAAAAKLRAPGSRKVVLELRLKVPGSAAFPAELPLTLKVRRVTR